jgi:photosystem II cytochrome c550
MSRNKYKYLLLAIATVMLVWQFFTSSVMAAETTDKAVRTVQLNDKEKVVLSSKEIAKGKKLFQSACANCHVGGATFTNPNVGLDPETLALATPARNTIVGLVDFMKNPTTFDGVDEIYDVHPSTRSTDIFPAMRGLTDKDLKLIAGYVLQQPNVRGIGWGGGKIYY